MDESLLTPEKTEFLYKHCEKRLVASIETREALGKKINYLLVALGALLALLIRSYLPDGLMLYETGLIAYVLLLMMATIWFCLRPQPCAPCGNEPSNLLTDEFCKQSIEQMIRLELLNYDDRIKRNVATNNGIGKCLNRVIGGMLFVPIVVVAIGAAS